MIRGGEGTFFLAFLVRGRIHSLSSCTYSFAVLQNIPGLVLLPSYLSHRDQRKLVRWALDDHARSPNETNLDTHYIIPEDGIWKKHLRSQKHSENRNADIQPRISTVLPNATSHSSQSDFGPRQLISNEAASPNNYVQLVSAPKPPSSPSLTVKPASATELVPKLRWANIGWYYHWGIKQYDFSRGKITVNETIKTICQEVVSNIRWDEVFDGTGREGSWGEDLDWTSWDKTYEPDAGIVNFYQIKDTLMAHVDRSEVSATSPLVSISLGCAAVFLIGGQSREVEPIPILLRSGDIVIMSGPQCRRAYHGVPRILDGTLPPHFEGSQEDEDDPDDWDAYEEYLRTTRININVRQVFPKGFDPNLDGT